MLWLNSYIKRIEEHAEAGTPERLTYAALECRLAIERVCYERLRISYDYVSEKDFVRRWTPKQVIDFLVAEGNDLAAQEFTLSIGKDPGKDTSNVVNAEQFDGVEWLVVGRQVGFDPKVMGKLWQALSSFLHVRMPKAKDDDLETYRDAAAMMRVLSGAVEELKRLSQGTLISSGLGETVSFECRCGMTNKRRTSLLTDGLALNCSNPRCNERYKAHLEPDAEYRFERLAVEVTCQHCHRVGYFPERAVIDIGLNKVASYNCGDCGELNHISWRLMQVSKS